MPWYSDYINITLLERGAYPLAGQIVQMDADDFMRMADDYNKQKSRRDAPIVVGHPEGDAPIYGSVSHLQERDNKLIATFTISSESFRQLWKQGAYGRHEPEFYAPDNPKNPKPGSWFLKHVGFIGPVPNMRGVLKGEASVISEGAK